MTKSYESSNLSEKSLMIVTDALPHRIVERHQWPLGHQHQLHPGWAGHLELSHAPQPVMT